MTRKTLAHNADLGESMSIAVVIAFFPGMAIGVPAGILMRS